MSDAAGIAITGCGVYLPGITDARQFLRTALGAETYVPSAGDPALPWKGLRYKDRATKLALAAARAALADAQLPIAAAEQQFGDSFGLVVSSNLGNVDTVCRALNTIRDGGVAATSPMDLPNCSSNVIASTIAICAGLRGLNLMLCNGATSGTDALYLATTAIRAGRASRMLVVGVEASSAEAARLLLTGGPRGVAGLNRLGEGAGALVLESAEAAASRSARPFGYLTAYRSSACADIGCSLAGIDGRAPGLWLTPAGFSEPSGEQERRRAYSAIASARHVDVSTTFGDLYGAAGVLQAVAASVWVRDTAAGCAAGTSGAMDGDGYASFLVEGRVRCGVPRS